MSNMIRQEIVKLIQRATGEKEEKIKVEKPEKEDLGDYSTNIALQLKKPADEIAEKLKGSDLFEKVEVAGPGFINFFISKSYLQKQVGDILRRKDKFGPVKIGKGKKVNIEFISANPTGPLHVGNSRGGIIGDVLSNILAKAGWKVTREYYFNDAGNQIDILGHSVLKDELAEYHGRYIDELAEKIKGKDAREVGKRAAGIIMEEIKKTVRKLGIKFDVWIAEGRDLRNKGKVQEIVGWLKKKKLAYEEDSALWFKSKQFGDDKDRVLLRSNGEPTYFALDCAYHKNKLVDRKFDKAINVWGADHYGDVARVKGFVKALGKEGKLDILVHQFVRVVKNGKEVRMSKRAGTYVAISDLLEEVALEAVRFFFLVRSANTHLDFDIDLAKQQSEKNPVYYVQYAHARICSILRKARSVNPGDKQTRLEHPSELNLIKLLIRLPEIIEDTAKDYQVQRLPQYAIDLAAAFHRFYRDCQVVEEGKANKARLDLIRAARIVLKNTLDLMGVSAPERM